MKQVEERITTHNQQQQKHRFKKKVHMFLVFLLRYIVWTLNVKWEFLSYWRGKVLIFFFPQHCFIYFYYTLYLTKLTQCNSFYTYIYHLIVSNFLVRQTRFQLHCSSKKNCLIHKFLLISIFNSWIDRIQ